ncbi:MAG: Gfo/Idh/MocA family oxidoreductase [Acidimicrobiia bacterium]|nr:Gfo/Idh/MocA family oxidoreductase [Acidimicrobiia bacterium]
MTLRIGILGAARIAPAALIRPARRVAEVEVAAVAARDRAKASAFAAKHGIAQVHDGYEDLLADPTIDAVYNPLPNGLHGRWTIAAIEAGKHVLCEKPFTANATEARQVAAVAKASDRVVMEAFHYRYHPMTARAIEIIASGELGEIRHVEAWMLIPLVRRNDIRWRLDLAGGSVMDVGCYALHQVRTYAGAEPEVVGASVRLLRPQIDRWLRADLRFGDGRTGRVTAAMLSHRPLSLGARITGSAGELRIRNPAAPQFLGRLSVRAGGAKRSERASREPTYLHQLRAFAGAVLRGEPFPTDVDDAVANMEAIDACYRAAGLEPRSPS